MLTDIAFAGDQFRIFASCGASDVSATFAFWNARNSPLSTFALPRFASSVTYVPSGLVHRLVPTVSFAFCGKPDTANTKERMTPAKTLKTVFTEYPPCYCRGARPSSYICD